LGGSKLSLEHGQPQLLSPAAAERAVFTSRVAVGYGAQPVVEGSRLQAALVEGEALLEKVERGPLFIQPVGMTIPDGRVVDGLLGEVEQGVGPAGDVGAAPWLTGGGGRGARGQ